MQPTPFLRDYSFTNFSTLNPAGQQPGVKLDAQFDGLKVTTDSILVNLALLQRDDGALKNAIVHLSSLGLDTVAALHAMGAIVAPWSTATLFPAGAFLVSGNVTYMAIVAHTSGANVAADVTAAKLVAVFDPYGGGGGGGTPASGFSKALLFTDIPATVIPAAVMSFVTSGRSVQGLYQATYVRDPDQTQYTTIGSGWIASAVSASAAQADVLACLSRVRLQSADGAWWVIDDSTIDVHAGHFGAIPDASVLYVAGTVTGTDAYPAGQALIDWRTYLRQYTASAAKDCIFPPGGFRLSKGLQLGYGDTGRTVKLRGARRGLENNATTLYTDFDDHPGIVISVGRNSGVSDMNIISPMGRAWLYNNEFGTLTHLAMVNHGLDERDLTSWNNPAQPNRSALLRYNPNTAISFDAYAGAAPSAAAAWAISTVIAAGEYRTANGKLFIALTAGTTAPSGTGPSIVAGKIRDGVLLVWAYAGPSTQSLAYPAALPPAYLPAANRITYGRGVGSSNMPIERVNIDGFSVGICLFPSGADGNGDFLKVSDVDIANTAICVSICNTQARNNDFYRFGYSFCHTVISNRSHGKQQGTMNGVWTECSGSAGVQLFNGVGQVTFNGCYIEAFWRLGEYGTSGQIGASMVWNGGAMYFGRHALTNGGMGVPLYLVGRDDSPTGAGGIASPIVLNNIDIGNFEGAASMRVVNLICNNVSFTPNDFSSVTTQWLARFHNSTAGTLVLPSGALKNDMVIRYSGQDETTLGNVQTRVTGRSVKNSSRDIPASLYTASLSPQYGAGLEEIINPSTNSVMSKSYFTSMALAGRILTFNAAFTTDYCNANDLVPGARITDDNQGHIFVIQTRTGTSGAYVFTCQMRVGFWYDNTGTIQYEQPFSTTLGNFYLAGGGVYTPGYPLYGDLTTGSGAIANCKRGDGYGGFISAITGAGGSMVQATDLLYINPFTDDNFVFDAGTRVTASAAAALTFSNNSKQTILSCRLPLFIRGS